MPVQAAGCAPPLPQGISAVPNPSASRGGSSLASSVKRQALRAAETGTRSWCAYQPTCHSVWPVLVGPEHNEWRQGSMGRWADPARFTSGIAIRGRNSRNGRNSIEVAGLFMFRPCPSGSEQSEHDPASAGCPDRVSSRRGGLEASLFRPVPAAISQVGTPETRAVSAYSDRSDLLRPKLVMLGASRSGIGIPRPYGPDRDYPSG
jgi:hypothetical protein